MPRRHEDTHKDKKKNSTLLKTFHPFTASHKMPAKGTGDSPSVKNPIHYYSGKLDIVAQGMGPCLRAVQAVHLALQASTGMVLGQTVNVKCPHAVSALMNQAKVTSVTSSHWGNWLATLTAPNIVIQRAPVTNPSSCMMSAMTEFVLEDEGEMTHDCVTLTYAATSEIAETPIENPELELFIDGSATHVSHFKVVPPPAEIG